MASEVDFAELYRKHTPGLLAFLRTRVSAARAEDILHDVWLAVLLQENVPGGDGFRRWIFRIAANAVKTFQRKASTRYEKGDLDPDRSPTALADVVVVPAEREELAARLRACIEQLPEPFRVVVQGRLGGESPEEIARRLNIPRNTVDSRFFKAKGQLAACIGPENA